MSGGNISGNTASGQGGGVYVYDGAFRIANGTVYGNDAPTTPIDLRNTASSGAALYISSGTSQHGTFVGGVWTSSGSLATTNNTIKVVNGVLQP